MRFFVALALIAGVVAACILADDTSGPSAAAPHLSTAATRVSTVRRPRVAPCRASALRVRFGGGSGVGMSQLNTGIELSNIGSVSCRLDGGVRVVWATGPDGHPVGPVARTPRGSRRDRGRVRRLTLRPGERASAPLDIVLGDGGLSAAQCHPEPVGGLRITPEGGRGALFIHAGTGDPAGACTTQPVAQLTVGRLTAD